MTYLVVRDKDGELVCFGPQNGMYKPVVKTGEVLSTEEALPQPSQQAKDKELKERKLEELIAKKIRDTTINDLKAAGKIDNDGEITAAGLADEE